MKTTFLFLLLDAEYINFTWFLIKNTKQNLNLKIGEKKKYFKMTAIKKVYQKMGDIEWGKTCSKEAWVGFKTLAAAVDFLRTLSDYITWIILI